MKRIPVTVISAAMALALAACTQTSPLRVSGSGDSAGAGESAEGGVLAFSQFPDLPIPSGAGMDVDNTLVFGGGEEWFGQIGLSAPHVPNDMYDFYKRNLPNYRWAEITSVRAPTSVMTYGRENRVLSIQITDQTLRGSYITLTVSPRENSGANGDTGGGI